MQAYRIAALTRTRPDFDYTDDDGAEAAFWNPVAFSGGMAWVGRYSSPSPWERHPDGDEFLYTVEGSIEVVVLAPEGEQRVQVPQGAFCVVPRGLWHRQIPGGTVIQTGATPGRTEHSDADDPRSDETRQAPPV